MTAFTLLPAGPAQLDDVLPLVAAFHVGEGVTQDPATRRKAVMTVLSAPHIGEIQLIMVAGEAVGYLCVAYGFSIEFNGRDGFLDEFFILPAHRGSGLGKAALARAMADMAARGLKALHLEVAAANRRAEALYASEGFDLRRGYHLMSARLDQA